MECPGCHISYCIDCEQGVDPRVFRCDKCLDVYEAQRRKDLAALNELEEQGIDDLVRRCLEAVKPVIVDYMQRSYVHGTRRSNGPTPRKL